MTRDLSVSPTSPSPTSQLARQTEAIAATLSPVLGGRRRIAWLAGLVPAEDFAQAQSSSSEERVVDPLGFSGPDRRGIDLPGCPIQRSDQPRNARRKRFILGLTP